MYDKILVALDGTEFSESVVSQVQDIARLNGSEVTLVTVMPEPEVYVVNGVVVSTVDQSIESERIEGEHYLRGVARRLEGQGIKTRSKVLYGKPTKEISRYARENDIGLIAMATHGHHGLGCVTHGCTVNKIRQSVPQPMLLYTPKAQLA